MQQNRDRVWAGFPQNGALWRSVQESSSSPTPCGKDNDRMHGSCHEEFAVFTLRPRLHRVIPDSWKLFEDSKVNKTRCFLQGAFVYRDTSHLKTECEVLSGLYGVCFFSCKINTKDTPRPFTSLLVCRAERSHWPFPAGAPLIEEKARKRNGRE